MPTYDYRCPECDHVQENFHSINSDPEIDCKLCDTIMKKVISGGIGFIINGGGTVRRNMRSRYGHKKTENMPTPTESAQAKATSKEQEAKHQNEMKKDPYYKFRD